MKKTEVSDFLKNVPRWLRDETFDTGRGDDCFTFFIPGGPQSAQTIIPCTPIDDSIAKPELYLCYVERKIHNFSRIRWFSIGNPTIRKIKITPFLRQISPWLRDETFETDRVDD